MMTTIQTPIDTVDVLMWLRRRDALSGLPYSLAEDARMLSEVRKAKTYRVLGLTWNRFCRERLRFGYSKADLMTRNYDEFGATYFVLAQLTRIRASQYRRIRGAISGNILRHNGVEIPITAANRSRLAAAIRELLRGAAAAHLQATLHRFGDVARFQDASQNIGQSLQPAEIN